MNRGNKGYAAIFLLLIVSVLLLVFSWLVRALEQREEEAEAAGCLATAVSGVKAEYNRYIFDRYHILLLDTGFGGRGRGEIENLIRISMEENSNFDTGEVALTEVRYLGEDSCAELKRQIGEAVIYLGLESAADELKGKTQGKDTPVSEAEMDRLEAETSGEDTDVTDDGGSGQNPGNSYAGYENEQRDASGENPAAGTPGSVGKAEGKGKKKDPRKTIRKITPAGLAFLLLPENARFSEAEVPFAEVPSKGIVIDDGLQVDSSFKKFSGLRKSVTSGNGWSRALVDNAATLVYAGKVFRCLTDPADEGEQSVLNLEMEYLVCGCRSDAENYKKTVRKLIALRTGVNFACLLTDQVRMAEVKGIAMSVTVLTPYLYPLVKYLIAGCWAYGESAADVYLLLRGKKLNLVKTHATWRTDISKLLRFSSLENEEGDAGGLTYREYLMILMAFHTDQLCLRMLDIMQINACQEDVPGGDPTMRMRNAVTAFGVDAEIRLSDETVYLHEEGGY